MHSFVRKQFPPERFWNGIQIVPKSDSQSAPVSQPN